jgi:uncharacterized protein YecT (DUF1311 family)
MQQNKTILMIMLTALIFIMAACGNSADESSATVDNQSVNDSSAQNTNEDSTENDLDTDSNDKETTVKDTNDKNEEGDTSEKASKEDEGSSTDDAETGLKEEYLQKLNEAKKEAEELEAADSSTYALKKVENDRWEIWDELLNEIYGVLEEQLPPEEMEQLREKQRDWIKHRDAAALEASQKYKGGTQEHLEYVAVLANLTEERCYELVADYMK